MTLDIYFVDEQEAVYSNTEESVLISNTGNKNQKKKGGKKTPQNDVEQTTDATYGNTGSRTVVSGLSRWGRCETLCTIYMC